jgi:hypothetical protein
VATSGCQSCAGAQPLWLPVAASLALRRCLCGCQWLPVLRWGTAFVATSGCQSCTEALPLRLPVAASLALGLCLCGCHWLPVLRWGTVFVLPVPHCTTENGGCRGRFSCATCRPMFPLAQEVFLFVRKTKSEPLNHQELYIMSVCYSLSVYTKLQ